MSQPSKSTTTNTTDTSGATRLEPAPDAEARQASEEWSENAALNTGLGQGKEGGGGAGGTSGGLSDTTNTAAVGGVAEPGINPPSQPGEFKPAGKSITEGGFDAPEQSAQFPEPGSKNDPGRVALGGFQEENTPFSGGAGPREDKVSNDGQYDALKDTSA